MGRGEAYRWAFATRAVALAAVVLASLASVSMAGALGQRCTHAHTRIAATSRAALQRAVVCLVNQQREHRGLPALRENARLNRSAQGWTNTMVAFRKFSHGSDFAERISAVGFRWSSLGENIATGFRTPAAVVRGWMASTRHCQNILSPRFRYVGAGVSARSILGAVGGTWTLDLGLLRGQPQASRNWGPADGCPY